MAKHTGVFSAAAEIDKFIEDLARFPERAEALKEDFRVKMESRGVAAHLPEAVVADSSDLDEFWDNVPI